MGIWPIRGSALSLCCNDGPFRPSKRQGRGRCRRSSEVVGKGRPTESSCLVRFHPRRDQLVLTHNSPCDVCVKYTSWFKSNDGRYLPHECRSHCTSTRMSHIWDHSCRYEQRKRVTWSLFLFRTEDWRKWRKRPPSSPPTTVLQKSHQWSGVSVGRNHYSETIISLSFLLRSVPRTPRYAYKVSRIQRSDCVGQILSHVYRPKLIMY